MATTGRQGCEDWSVLPQGAATFVLPVRLAMTTRRPFSEVATLLQPGERLFLRPEPQHPLDPHAVRLDTASGAAAGYLYAQTAAWLSLLLRFLPSCGDESRVLAVLRRPEPPQPLTSRKRYPIVTVRLQLTLPEAWPLYVLAAVIGFRDEHFAQHFNLAQNEFLQPLWIGFEQQQALGCDHFTLPPSISRAWYDLTHNILPLSSS